MHGALLVNVHEIDSCILVYVLLYIRKNITGVEN